jgi:hypothetical protein
MAQNEGGIVDIQRARPYELCAGKYGLTGDCRHDEGRDSDNRDGRWNRREDGISIRLLLWSPEHTRYFMYV